MRRKKRQIVAVFSTKSGPSRGRRRNYQLQGWGLLLAFSLLARHHRNSVDFIWSKMALLTSNLEIPPECGRGKGMGVLDSLGDKLKDSRAKALSQMLLVKIRLTRNVHTL